jgi:quinol monooxygenase YgiN
MGRRVGYVAVMASFGAKKSPPAVSRIGFLLRPSVNAASGAAVTQGEHHGQVLVSRRSLEAGAVSELQGIARFKFHEGKLEEFKRLSAQCMEIVRTKDTGTLQYEIYFNDDQSECMVLERYRDSEALIEHAAHIGDLMEVIVSTGSVSGELLGEPSAELRANLADGPVRLFTPFQSM